ncbi:MAG: DNA replication/repair protein RecF [Clostridia bacterium]|nr:DNA replication/repair protein RecF [Clostridia bacterium]
MQVEKLCLQNFRNYEKAEIEFSSGVNLIYGNNGHGKTNIAEAVYLFSAARSHRTSREKDMIRLGEDYLRAKLFYKTESRDMEAEFRIFKDKSHFISRNGVENIKNSEFIGSFLAVMFSPEDFSFIKDGPGERRKFMDIAISQLKPNYFKLLSEYNRYLKSKMKALKNPAYHVMLDVYNEHLATLGAKIMLYRNAFIEALKPKLNRINQEITSLPDELILEYQSCVPFTSDEEKLKKRLLQKLERVRKRELFDKICHAGLQKEDLDFTLKDIKLRDFGSQGQIRTAVLAVKMAQAELVEESYGEYPVLILDDILSELDASRRKYLLNEIRGKQVIITGTDKANFGKRKDTKLIYIENGKIRYDNIQEKE